MKNYHAVGIAICSAVIITCALSLTDTVRADTTERPAICPTPTESNSGYVVTDENNDGVQDTVWHIYVKGVCAGFTVSPNDKGTPL